MVEFRDSGRDAPPHIEAAVLCCWHSAGHQGIADARVVQDSQHLVGRENRPVGLAIVDMGIKNRDLLAVTGVTLPLAGRS
jgi:hypothetical protein